jgi:hypothetical protein
MTIIINNIAGLTPNTGKMNDIMQWINAKNCDIFLGHEANVLFENEKMLHYMANQWIPRSCIKIAEYK